MNKIYLSALALIASATISAQVLNPSFENWTAGEPDDWTLENPTDGTLDVAIPVTEGTTLTSIPDGTSYIRLETFSVAGSTDTSFTNGVYGAVASQMFASTVEHSDFTFDVQYDMEGSDVGTFFVAALNAQNQFVGQSYEDIVGSSTGWESKTISMTYTGVPVNFLIMISSSEAEIFGVQPGVMPAEKGSWIAVDNIVAGAAAIEADGVSNIIASDIDDNGNGSDLEVVFDAAADETTVSEYRIIAIESGLTLVDWSVAPAEAYTAVTPNGDANYTQIFAQNAKYIASDGAGGATIEDIVENVEMDIYVYSVADGTNATANSISGPSNAITLTSPLSVTDQYKEISIYPNPANNFVNFKVDGLENGTVSISSITGQEVVNTTINGTEKVDVSKLKNGVYIYNVRNQNGEVVKTNKLVISK